MTVNDNEQCVQFRRELGVYVLGAIEPAQRAAVRRHMDMCVCCRMEIAAMAALPALLGKIPLAEAGRLLLTEAGGQTGELLLSRLLERAARLRRRRRWLVTATITILALVAAWSLLVQTLA